MDSLSSVQLMSELGKEFQMASLLLLPLLIVCINVDVIVIIAIVVVLVIAIIITIITIITILLLLIIIDYYTRSPLKDSRLFGPSPWKILRYYL